MRAPLHGQSPGVVLGSLILSSELAILRGTHRGRSTFYLPPPLDGPGDPMRLAGHPGDGTAVLGPPSCPFLPPGGTDGSVDFRRHARRIVEVDARKPRRRSRPRL